MNPYLKSCGKYTSDHMRLFLIFTVALIPENKLLIKQSQNTEKPSMHT